MLKHVEACFERIGRVHADVQRFVRQTVHLVLVKGLSEGASHTVAVCVLRACLERIRETQGREDCPVGGGCGMQAVEEAARRWETGGRAGREVQARVCMLAGWEGDNSDDDFF